MASQAGGTGSGTSEQVVVAGAEELERRTIAALASMAGMQGHPDAPAAKLGQVLSNDDLRRIGSGAAGVATSALQGGEAGQGSVPAPGPVFDWQEVVPHPSVNRFWHAARLTDATWRDGGCPNNDTLYSLSWVDVSQEPVILSHPDMGDRYFTFQLAAMPSDNFAYVGRRTTGSNTP